MVHSIASCHGYCRRPPPLASTEEFDIACSKTLRALLLVCIQLLRHHIRNTDAGAYCRGEVVVRLEGLYVRRGKRQEEHTAVAIVQHRAMVGAQQATSTSCILRLNRSNPDP